MARVMLPGEGNWREELDASASAPRDGSGVRRAMPHLRSVLSMRWPARLHLVGAGMASRSPGKIQSGCSITSPLRRMISCQ